MPTLARCQSPLEGLGAAATVQQVLATPPSVGSAVWRLTRTDEVSREFAASFESAVKTPEPVNNLVPMTLLLPAADRFNPPFPVVIALHYLGARDLRVERALARNLNRQGIGALLVVLPYHLSRAPEGTRSGELAVQPNAEVLTATMVQSIQDVRRALQQTLLRPDIDSQRIGISGISLGALVAELVFGVEPRISHAAFLLGGVDLAHILWTSSRVIVSRDEFRRRGFSESDLRAALKPIEPSEYLRRRLKSTTASNALVVIARFDTVIAPAASRELVRDLYKPVRLTLDTGHYGGLFVQRELLNITANYFRAATSGEVFVPPRGIHAPTLRLLAQGISKLGFDIGVGIDLFRTREAKEVFGSLAVTPRGPELYLGKQIGGGFSVGAMGSTRGFGLGLLWSTVL